jgi:hypothetical protein
VRFLSTIPNAKKRDQTLGVTHVPEIGKNTSVFLPGEHCVVPQNHPLATSGKYPPGSQIPDMCPITQVWRGNVDVKLLLYQSYPINPDPEDSITCSDYLVGYQMKGSQTIAIERKNMKDVVMRMEDKNGDITGLFLCSSETFEYGFC